MKQIGNKQRGKRSLPVVERRKLADLTPHLLQATFFDDLPDHELQALADDISRNGQHDPIVLMPNGVTILDGRQRQRALQLLGKNHVDVIIRTDLADADEATIEREFLGYNQLRRQLTPLAKLRVAVRLLEIEHGRGPGSLLRGLDDKTRNRIRKALNMSDRNLSRYLLVLRAPLEIQRAFEAGKLSLVVAGKVSLLPEKVQQVIADRVRRDAVPKSVVAEYLKAGSKRHVKSGDAFAAFMRSLARAVEDVKGRTAKVSATAIGEHIDTIKEARAILRELWDRHKADEAV